MIEQKCRELALNTVGTPAMMHCLWSLRIDRVKLPRSGTECSGYVRNIVYVTRIEKDGLHIYDSCCQHTRKNGISYTSPCILFVFWAHDGQYWLSHVFNVPVATLCCWFPNVLSSETARTCQHNSLMVILYLFIQEFIVPVIFTPLACCKDLWRNVTRGK